MVGRGHEAVVFHHQVVLLFQRLQFLLLFGREFR
jgi:hypothetical protein